MEIEVTGTGTRPGREQRNQILGGQIGKRSLIIICPKGKSMTPCLGNTVLLSSNSLVSVQMMQNVDLLVCKNHSFYTDPWLWKANPNRIESSSWVHPTCKSVLACSAFAQALLSLSSASVPSSSVADKV